MQVFEERDTLKSLLMMFHESICCNEDTREVHVGDQNSGLLRVTDLAAQLSILPRAGDEIFRPSGDHAKTALLELAESWNSEI